jgi:hypothetical protein
MKIYGVHFILHFDKIYRIHHTYMIHVKIRMYRYIGVLVVRFGSVVGQKLIQSKKKLQNSNFMQFNYILCGLIM